jgi:hypothetical protein
MVPIFRLSILLAACITSLSSWGSEADGDRDTFLESRHIFMLGGYWQEVDAKIRETRDPLPRVGLKLEQLGVDEDDATWYLEYRYRFSNRWAFVGAGQRFTSGGEIGLNRDINFGGVVFPAGVSLNTRIRIDTYFADIMYRAYQTPRAEVAIGGGLHIFNFEASLHGRTFVENRLVDRSRELIASSSDLIAPLPNLRLQAYYAITDHWAIAGNMGWMSANVDEWDGNFRYVHLRTHLRLNKHVGVALGYQFTDVDVSRDRRSASSEYNIEFSGPSLMLTVAF